MGQIVASCLKKNPVAAADLPALIASVYQSVSALGEPAAVAVEGPKPAVPIRRSAQQDVVICVECGWRGKVLRRHLMNDHSFSPKEYRERWQLSADHPLTAPSYTVRRAEFAKQPGLGRRHDQ